MRIIQTQNSRRVKRKNYGPRVIFIIYIIVLLVTGFYFYRLDASYASSGEQSTGLGVASNPAQKVFRNFNGEEFKDLYNNFRYANTNRIIEQPIITGNVVADERIRVLAESRGYRLRRIARSTLGEADGLPLQRIAEKSWTEMKAEAAKSGLILTATWAFRTIEDQRDIFLSGLAAYGIAAQDIANGSVDDGVDKVLQTYAPPGYSRHHTGFTVDLTCGTGGLTNFAITACSEWLARNNYQNAKAFGWIPSYPEGASMQGPEPEPWEYIWVSVDTLLE